LDREERLAVLTLKQEYIAALCDLSQRVYSSATSANGHERWRRWQVAIPDVVPDCLEVPDALAGIRFQSQERVRKEVVANPVGPVKVECRGPRRYEHQASPGVEAHA